LVLGILGLVLFGVLSPIAWWLGAAELRDIQSGLAPQSGQGLATAGMILGIIGTVIWVLGWCGGVLYILFLLGLIAAGIGLSL